MKKIFVLILSAVLCLISLPTRATVATSTSRVQYSCNNSTTDFAFTFGIKETSEIDVILTTSTGTETTLAETTNYSVACTNDDCSSGGTVTTVSTYDTGNTITIIRDVPLTQESDFTENMATLFETFEDELDKGRRIDQQLQEQITRTPKLAKSSAYSSTGYSFPDPVANEYIKWNASASDLESDTPSSQDDLPFHFLSDYDDLASAASTLNALDVDCTLIIDEDQTMDESVSFDVEVSIMPTAGNVITFGAYDLTINKLSPTGSFQWLSINSTGNLILNKGAIKEIDTAWAGFGSSGTAASNATALSELLYTAMTGGIDLYLNLDGGCSCNAVSYTYSGSTNLAAIKIHGNRGDICEYTGKNGYLDFSGLSGSSKALSIINAGSAGTHIEGLEFENFAMFGPGKTTGTVTGIYTGTSGEATSGVHYFTMKNVRVDRFYTGADIQSANNWPFITEGCMFTNCGLGLRIQQSTVGTHTGLDTNGSTVGVLLDRCLSQTFNSPVFQSNNFGLIVDTQTGDSHGLYVNSPYFETIAGYCFGIGYKRDETASGAGNCYAMVVNGGTYDPGGVTTVFMKSSLGASFESATFNNICFKNTTVTSPSVLFNTNTPRNASISLERNGTQIQFYYDANGNLLSGGLPTLKTEQLLSSTEVALDATGDTALYTVPTGYRCVITKAIIVAGSDGGNSQITIGQDGAETDFLGTQTISNLDAQYDAVILQPIPNATPVKQKSYEAATVIDVSVDTADGGSSNTVYLYGFLY